jgi:hypothetical protein
MPLRDLPPFYSLDPALRDVSARLQDKAESYLSEALECCEALASRNDPNDYLSIGNDLIAVQVNVMAHRLHCAVEAVTPDRAKTLTHDVLVQRVVADVVRRALEAHLERQRTA